MNKPHYVCVNKNSHVNNIELKITSISVTSMAWSSASGPSIWGAGMSTMGSGCLKIIIQLIKPQNYK